MSVPLRRVLEAPSLPTSFKEGKETDGCSPLPIRKSLSFPDLAAMEVALSNELARERSIPIPPIPPPLPGSKEPPVPPKMQFPPKMYYEPQDSPEMEQKCKPPPFATNPQQLSVAVSELHSAKRNLRKVVGGRQLHSKLPSAYIRPYIESGRRMSDSTVNTGGLLHKFNQQDIPVPFQSHDLDKKNVYENEEEEEEAEYADALDIQALKIHEPWFFPYANRDYEETHILNTGLDGTYLVRKSRGLNIWQPFTLTVLYKSKLFRLKIRYLHSGEYALGEKKDDEIKFPSVQALVTHYQKIPLILMGAEGGRTLLKYIPTNL